MVSNWTTMKNILDPGRSVSILHQTSSYRSTTGCHNPEDHDLNTDRLFSFHVAVFWLWSRVVMWKDTNVSEVHHRHSEYPTTSLHGVRNQKTTIWIFIATEPEVSNIFQSCSTHSEEFHGNILKISSNHRLSMPLISSRPSESLLYNVWSW